MASEKPSIHNLSREMPSATELEDIVSSVETADARATVLVLSAFADNILERAIALNFVPMNQKKSNRLFRDQGAPLGRLSAKIMLAHALGILGDEEKSQLDRIRSIRNAFAHTIKTINFDTRLINDECHKLDPQRLIKNKYVPQTDTAREKFVTTIFLISTCIMLYVTNRTSS